MITLRRIMHRKKRMKEGWRNDQVSFKPGSNNYHDAYNKHRQGLSSFWKEQDENRNDHTYKNGEPEYRRKFTCKKIRKVGFFGFLHFECRDQVFIDIKIEVQ